MLELDSELVARPPASLDHERERIRGECRVRVLDEIRVARRDLRAADPVPAQPTRLEHPAGGQLVLRVLEHAAERALVRRLGVFPLLLHPRDDLLDLVERPRRQMELDRRHDLAWTEVRAAVVHPQLGRSQPAGALRIDHECACHHPGNFPTIGSRVHPYPAPGRPGNRTREFEAAELCFPCSVKAHGEGRTAAREQPPGISPLDLRQVACELEHEPFEAVVGRQKI